MARETVLRPHAHLLSRGIVAVLALTMPVFAVLYWLAEPSGAWPAVLVAHVVVTLVTILAVYSFFSTTVTVGPGVVRERRFPGHEVVTHPSDVSSVTLVHLYEGSTLDTLPQLFVTGKDGRNRLRLRGQFWSPEAMERVAEEFEVPVTRPEESMTMKQLRRSSPQLLSWFERLPRVGR
ncbi:hypothetical protein [Leifsonia sp. AG29]|uniref:hypothetical protein n=1 Tax=Leifsonia sp. AG29 TaxID=2598860 RepID=UPI001E639EEC|nr:hypothetical protein [Leifsonia sp. AG29]